MTAAEMPPDYVQRDVAASADLAAMAIVHMIKAQSPRYPADQACHDAARGIVEAVVAAVACSWRRE